MRRARAIEAPIIFSIALGAGIGVLYGCGAYLTHKRAVRLRGQQFVAYVLGGMLVRMVLMLVAVVATVMLLPIEIAPFAVALISVLVLGLVAEVTLVMRHVRNGNDGDESS